MRFQSTVALAIACALGFATPAVAAPLVFTATPNARNATLDATYRLFAGFLAGAARNPVRYENAHSLFAYASLMGQRKFDIVFDGPQFTAWRDAREGYRPIVRLRPPLVFEILVGAGAQDARIQVPRDLDGQTVCVPPFPNLATIVLDNHTSQVASPSIVVRPGPKQDLHAFLKGDCVATVVPKKLAMKTSPGVARVLYTSQAYPNLTVSVSPKVSRAVRQRLRAALLSPRGEALAKRIFGQTFVPAHRAEYTPYAGMLNQSFLFSALTGMSTAAPVPAARGEQ